MKKYKNFISLLFIFLLPFYLQGQIPSGYYDDASGKTGSELKTALYNIIKDHTVITYNSIWTHFQNTDKKPNGKVWDMYSDIPGNPPYQYEFILNQCTEGSVPFENSCYNREHTFPRSWYGSQEDVPMYTDLFHIYPADAWVNELRSNYPYGVVNSPITTTLNGGKLGNNSTAGYSGLVFEPIDEYKGDFARTYFYMVTRYEDLVAGWHSNSPQCAAVLQSNTFPVFKDWYLDLLLQWHTDDPVSQKEIDRNNAVYAIQGNRNPYIDHPEYVNCVWAGCLEDEPAYHVTDFSAHTITLNWEDAVGTLLPDGYLIRMSDTGFESIIDPVDGIPVNNDFWNRNITYGVQHAVFGSLTPNMTYYFKIYSYRGSGSSIDYKTDGSVQQLSIMAK